MSELIRPRRKVHSSLPHLLYHTSIPLLALSFSLSSPPGAPLSHIPFSSPHPRFFSSELSHSLSRSASIHLSCLRCNGLSLLASASPLRLIATITAILSLISLISSSCPFFVRRSLSLSGSLSFSFISLFKPHHSVQDAGARRCPGRARLFRTAEL